MLIVLSSEAAKLVAVARAPTSWTWIRHLVKGLDFTTPKQKTLVLPLRPSVDDIEGRVG